MGDPSCRKGPYCVSILTQLSSGQAQHPQLPMLLEAKGEFPSQKADLELGSWENPESFVERGSLPIPLCKHRRLQAEFFLLRQCPQLFMSVVLCSFFYIDLT